MSILKVDMYNNSAFIQSSCKKYYGLTTYVSIFQLVPNCRSVSSYTNPVISCHVGVEGCFLTRQTTLFCWPDFKSGQSR